MELRMEIHDLQIKACVEGLTLKESRNFSVDTFLSE